MAKVALFVPCYMEVLRPRDAEHAEAVLRALGDDVDCVRGRCCGQPGFNAGFRAEAKAVGRELLREAREHEVIVVPSGSCTSMVHHYLPGLFEGREAAAEGIARRFVEFSDYVSRHPAIDRLRLRLGGVVTFHDSCHARRELGVTERSLSLLGRIEGLEVRRLAYEEECCGFGGTFSVKLPEVSAGMMAAKLADVRGTGARVMVSGDLSCLAHMEAGARGTGQELETWTVAELMARALA